MGPCASGVRTRSATLVNSTVCGVGCQTGPCCDPSPWWVGSRDPALVWPSPSRRPQLGYITGIKFFGDDSSEAFEILVAAAKEP